MNAPSLNTYPWSDVPSQPPLACSFSCGCMAVAVPVANRACWDNKAVGYCPARFRVANHSRALVEMACYLGERGTIYLRHQLSHKTRPATGTATAIRPQLATQLAGGTNWRQPASQKRAGLCSLRR
jgi:hypothetical protein